MRREGTETRLGNSRGRARCAGESERRRNRGLTWVHSCCRQAFILHLCIYCSHQLWFACLYTFTFLYTCPHAFTAQSGQIRTLALAYRSLNQGYPKLNEIGVAQGLRASVPRVLLPNIRQNANFTSLYVCLPHSLRLQVTPSPAVRKAIRSIFFLTVFLAPQPCLIHSRRAGNVRGLIPSAPPPFRIPLLP